MELFKLMGSVFVDNSKANESLQKTDGLAGKLGKGFVAAGKTVVAAGTAIGAACVGIGTAAVKSFGDFEASLNKVATIADPSVKSMDQIKKEVLSLSSDMGVAAGDINEAMYQAISATGDTANALKYVEQASKLAKGGFTDTSTALEAAAKTMNAYGQSGEDAFAKIGDIMMQVQNQGITDISKLSGALANVVPTAASLGVSFENVGAALATMTAQGTETSVATTQLRAAMVELSKSGTKAQEEFQKMSGTTFSDFIAQGGNVSEAMQLMAQSAEAQGLTMMDLFGSVEAAQAALALTGDGAEKFVQSMDAMNNSAGATEAAYSQMSEGVNASFNKLLNAGKNLLLMIGDKLAPVVEKIAEKFANFTVELMAAYQETGSLMGAIKKVCPEIAKLIEKAIEVAKELRDNLGKAITWVSDNLNILIPLLSGAVAGIVAFKVISTAVKLFNTMKTIITTCSGAMGAFNAIMAANPIGLVCAAIGALIAIGVALYMNWDTIVEYAKKLWEVIKDVWGKITQSFSDLWQDLKGFCSNFFNVGKDIFSSMWEGIKSVWTNISNWVSDKVTWLADKLMFWRNSTDEMASGTVDGSHANGLSYVPFDNYVARLHVGERVLTRAENEEYTQSKSRTTQSDTLQVDMSKVEELLYKLNSTLTGLKDTVQDGALMGYTAR